MLKTIILTIVIGGLFCIAAGVAFIYSGFYPVAATVPHNPVIAWVLDTTMENSVRYHATDLSPPFPIDDPQLIRQGAGLYHEDCQVCHGGPGVERSELAKGLLPEPPDLGKAADEWTPAELHWIVKHGIKMTGMPAWGPTHTDPELWALVAFIRRLDKFTPEQFKALGSAAAAPVDQAR
jgi:mono/diheme cytochrome c family protein